MAGLLECDGTVEINKNTIKTSFVLDSRIGIFTGTSTLTSSTCFENLNETLTNLGVNVQESKKRIYYVSKKLDI